jgi:hypothetical protein
LQTLGLSLPPDLKELKDLSKIYKQLRYIKVLQISGLEIPYKKILKLFKSKKLKGIQLVAPQTKLTQDEAFALTNKYPLCELVVSLASHN